MAENIISASHLAYAVRGRTLLHDVSFGIDENSRIGLIGDNGAGKSTLLRLLYGALTADSGTLARRSGCRIGLLEQVPSLPDDTIYAALCEPFAATIAAIKKLQHLGPGQAYDELAHTIETQGGWQWSATLARVAKTLNLTELDRPCQTLSGGDRKRVALCRLLLQNPDVVLLDEPTNHLDTSTVALLERLLGPSTMAVVVVTHDRYFLDRVATQMAELRQGVLRSYRGNYSDYLVARAEQEAQQARTEARQLRVLAHELDWASRSPQARTTKNSARLERIEASRALIDGKMQLHQVDALRFGKGPRLGKSVLRLNEVSFAHEGHKALFAPLSVELSAHERWGIIGANGCGKTTLLTLITGAQKPTSGTIIRGQNTVLAYFDQHRTELDAEASVQQVLVPGGGDTVFFAGAPLHIRSWLQKFAFDAEAQRMRVSALSGGERNRLALAKLMLTEANVLILDEPTNDLDLLTLGVLEEALLQYSGCVIVVSHDRYFLDRVATHTLNFVANDSDAMSTEEHARSTIVIGTGGYSDAQSRLQTAPSKASDLQDENKRASQRHPGRATTKKKKRTYKEERELAGMEAAIEAHEAQSQAMEVQLQDAQIWQHDGGAQGRVLTERLQACQNATRALYERWQQLLDLD